MESGLKPPLVPFLQVQVSTWPNVRFHVSLGKCRVRPQPSGFLCQSPRSEAWVLVVLRV